MYPTGTFSPSPVPGTNPELIFRQISGGDRHCSHSTTKKTGADSVDCRPGQTNFNKNSRCI